MFQAAIAEAVSVPVVTSSLMQVAQVNRMLAPGREEEGGDFPPGDFIEHDLDEEGRLQPVERPYGKNQANVVVGVIRSFTEKHPEGMGRVLLLGDPSRELGSLAEPECRRIAAAFDLARDLDHEVVRGAGQCPGAHLGIRRAERQPALGRRVGQKHQRGLTPAELDTVMKIAGPTMSRLGYR